MVHPILGHLWNTIPVNHIDTDVVWKVGTYDSIIAATPRTWAREEREAPIERLLANS